MPTLNSLTADNLLTEKEILTILDLAFKLKAQKKAGKRPQLLAGKNIALLFEKTSTRTRAAFTVAANDLGAFPEFLGKADIQFGTKESLEDTAKVLGRMFDGIEYRGAKQSVVDGLAQHSGVPVWNGLTDEWHPTQMFADLLTLKEHFGYLKGLTVCFVGDGRNNVANSLTIGCLKVGVNVVIIAPKQLQPATNIVDIAQQCSQISGATYFVSDNIEDVKGADAIYTDVWVSMGEENQYEERIKLLKNYQVNEALMTATGKKSVFLHCLPAFHDLETEVGKEVYHSYGLAELEVTDAVFRSKDSLVFDQAENRMHTIKAIMVASYHQL